MAGYFGRRTMTIGSKTFLLTSGLGALIAVMVVGLPQPAQAQFGIGIPGIGNFYIGPGGCGRRCRDQRRRGKTPRDGGEQSDSGSRPGKPDKVMAGQGAPSAAEQTRVLQRIASSAVVTDVGSTKDLNEVGQQSLANDKNRDYTTKITEIIDAFKKAERKGREEARRESRGESREMTAGDVTAHGIEQSLEKAVKSAKLDTFERFVNEAWTSERIRVMILDRVLNDLPPLFEGNNRGLAPMEALESLITRAAETSYRRIFETSEFLAVNHVSTVFVRSALSDAWRAGERRTQGVDRRHPDARSGGGNVVPMRPRCAAVAATAKATCCAIARSASSTTASPKTSRSSPRRKPKSGRSVKSSTGSWRRAVPSAASGSKTSSARPTAN